ncbi:MAG: hypothetical protein PWP03_108 [Candidatus Woesearchaeota archaeon]|nr:hypothetical protein [Candidatus Woesearchaeota archaeon]
MIKNNSHWNKIIEKIRTGVQIGILGQGILTVLPHVFSPTIDDLKKIMINLGLCSAEFMGLEFLLNVFGDEARMKGYTQVFEHSKNEKQQNPVRLCNTAYSSIKKRDFNKFIESCIKLTGILSYDENARVITKNLTNDTSLSSLLSKYSKDVDIRDATNFLFSLMKGEDVLNAYENYKVARFDNNSLLKLYLNLYEKKFNTASKLMESLIRNTDRFELKELNSSKNEVLELKFKEYDAGSFILKKVNPSVIKEYNIEKLIFSTMPSKNTPTPLGIFEINGKDYFVQEIIIGSALNNVSSEELRKKYLTKTLDTLLDIDFQLSEKSNLINLSDSVSKIDYEDTIVSSFKKANKDSLEILLDKLFKVNVYLSQASDWFNHGDIHPGNVIVSNDNLLIIDFEKALLSTKYFDFLFFTGQPVFNLSLEDEYELVNNYSDYKINDEALFYSTGFFVNLIITTRSSKWYHESGSENYKDMEHYFLAKTLQYLDKVPFDIDKEKIKGILVSEFNE